MGKERMGGRTERQNEGLKEGRKEGRQAGRQAGWFLVSKL